MRSPVNSIQILEMYDEEKKRQVPFTYPTQSPSIADMEKGHITPISTKKPKTIFAWVFGEEHVPVMERTYLGGRLSFFPFALLCASLFVALFFIIFIAAILSKLPGIMSSLQNMQTVTFNNIAVSSTTNSTMQMAVSLSDTRNFGIPVSGTIKAPLVMKIMSPANNNNVALKITIQNDMPFSGNQPNNLDMSILVELIDTQGVLALIQCSTCNTSTGMPVTTVLTTTINAMGMNVMNGASYTMTQNIMTGKNNSITNMLNQLPQGIFRPNLNQAIRSANPASQLYSLGDPRLPDIHLVKVDPATSGMGAIFKFQMENPLMVSFSMTSGGLSIGENGNIVADTSITSAVQNQAINMQNAPGVQTFDIALSITPTGNVINLLTTASSFISGGSVQVSNIKSVVGGGHFFETMLNKYTMSFSQNNGASTTSAGGFSLGKTLKLAAALPFATDLLGNQAGNIISNVMSQDSTMNGIKATNITITSMTNTSMGLSIKIESKQSLGFDSVATLTVGAINLGLTSNPNQPMMKITLPAPMSIDGSQPISMVINPTIDLVDIPTVQSVTQKFAEAFIGDKGNGDPGVKMQISTPVTFSVYNTTILDQTMFTFGLGLGGLTAMNINTQNGTSVAPTGANTATGSSMVNVIMRDNLNQQIKAMNPNKVLLCPVEGGPLVLITSIVGGGIGGSLVGNMQMGVAMENPLMGQFGMTSAKMNLKINGDEMAYITVNEANPGSLTLKNVDGPQNLTAKASVVVKASNIGKLITDWGTLNGNVVGPMSITIPNAQGDMVQTMTQNVNVKVSPALLGIMGLIAQSTPLQTIFDTLTKAASGQ